MVLVLLSLIVAAIFVAISVMRYRIWFKKLIRAEIVREDSSMTKERVEQSRIAGSMRKFLVVVLPDGTIVTPRAAGQV